MNYRLILPLLALTASPAMAQHSCAFSNPGGTLVDFGIYTALQGEHDATGTIDFNCVPDLLLGVAVPYTISISEGSSGSFSARQLRAGSNTLEYNLYVDVLRTLIWGDGTLGTATVSGACTGACSVLVYGRMPGGQVGPAGPYQDDVIVTVNF